MNQLAPFGWRTSWMAVAGSVNPHLLASDLSFRDSAPCEWDSGIRETGGKAIFISPLVSGWTLIVGAKLSDAQHDDTLPLIVRLSETQGAAQYFGNHRVPDYYAWAKAERGRLIRAYAYLGEQGATLWDRGELTKEEIALGLVFEDVVSPSPASGAPVLEILKGLKEKRSRYPREDDVFAIAREWSVDPTRIEEYEIRDSLGTLAYSESRGQDRRT